MSRLSEIEIEALIGRIMTRFDVDYVTVRYLIDEWTADYNIDIVEDN